MIIFQKLTIPFRNNFTFSNLSLQSNANINQTEITLFKKGFNRVDTYEIDFKKAIGKPRSIQSINYKSTSFIQLVPIYMLVLKAIFPNKNGSSNSNTNH